MLTAHPAALGEHGSDQVDQHHIDQDTSGQSVDDALRHNGALAIVIPAVTDANANCNADGRRQGVDQTQEQCTPNAEADADCRRTNGKALEKL